MIVTTIRIENTDPNVTISLSSKITEILEREHVSYDGGSSAGVMYFEIKGNIEMMKFSRDIEEMKADGSVKVDIKRKPT